MTYHIRVVGAVVLPYATAVSSSYVLLLLQWPNCLYIVVAAPTTARTMQIIKNILVENKKLFEKNFSVA